MAQMKWFSSEESEELHRFGYFLNEDTIKRHHALDRAIISDRNSGIEVFHKLLGLSNVTQNSQPMNSEKYKSDANYVKKRFMNTKFW